MSAHPPVPRPRASYPFSTMKVKESWLLPKDGNVLSARAAAYKDGLRYGRVFRSAKDPETQQIRFWRVA